MSNPRIGLVSGERAPATKTHRFAVVCGDAAGQPENAGAPLPTIAIYDRGQAKWWNDVGAVWQGAKVANDTVAVDAADLVGAYEFSLDLDTLVAKETELFIEVTRADTGDDGMHIVFVRHEGLTGVITDDGAVADPVSTIQDLFHALRVVHTHKQVLSDDTKTHQFLESGGVAVALEFDCTDAQDVPTVREVFNKTRTP